MPFDPAPLREGLMWGFRPTSYFAPKPDLQQLLATVKGTARRHYIEILADEGRLDEALPEASGESLSEPLRRNMGRIHPRLMGGEYLPNWRPGEIEIARIELASVTGDVTSVRARPVGSRIAYRIVDEYDYEFTCRPCTTRLPLTLDELVKMIDASSENGGPAFGPLEDNADAGGMHPDSLRDFVQARSVFYGELGDWYAIAADAWLDAWKADFYPGEEKNR